MKVRDGPNILMGLTTYVCQVYIPALEGHLPPDVLRAFRALLEFFYIARQDVITEDGLKELEDATKRFHIFQEVFTPIH